MALGVSATFLWRSHDASQPPRLEAMETALTVRGNTALTPGSRMKVVFQLKNPTQTAVTIESVATSCSCLLPAEVEGATIGPGGALPLETLVGVPEMGKSLQRLQVFHNGTGSPLELTVTIEGRRTLPTLGEVVNGAPFFDELSDVQALQTLVVNTFEEVGSPPWLGELVSPHPSVKITRGGISEKADQTPGVLRRTYEYTIGWSEIPARREVRALLYAKTDIDPEPGAYVGSVAALMPQAKFAPTVVSLQQSKVEQDWVAFGAGSGVPHKWRIAEDAQLPEWLHLEWQETDGNLLLKVSLTHAYKGTEAVRCHVPLIHDEKSSETLSVVAHPAS